ncbi:MAG: argininosuccinate lyase [Armatimonadetes bacterium]|nr:argininosuccinate lyase [Armatimonadota bacterium]
MTKKTWSGRFSKSTDKLIERFTESITFDCRLIEHDIRGSIAHAQMLGSCGIISQADSDSIVDGLNEILADIRTHGVEVDESVEDVHTYIEKLLFDKIGEIAGKLHTARSRNDQVCLDIRLFLKHEIAAISGALSKFQAVIIDKAEEHVESIMPGLTHLQHAQPITLGHHLMAWFWMLERDKDRFADCLKRINVSPIGTGALAGTTFPIDRDYVAKELGFASVSENSIDSVADRDFASEFLAAAAILMVHLSRFAEEIVLWNTPEFGFVELDDSVTTGSSIMPQKKNPDVAELVRGKSGRVIGNLITLLTIQKGLPMAYNRDLQEDKEPLFDTVDTVRMSLDAFALMLSTAKFNAERMRKAAAEGFLTATDLADHLVRQGVPFRTAHEQVGKLVSWCLENQKDLLNLTIDEIRQFAPKAKEDVISQLTIEASVAARSSYGGTAPSEVRRQIQKARSVLEGKVQTF